MNKIPNIKGKPIQLKSIELEKDSIELFDYPDFCDAYCSYGEFIDGTVLTEEELRTFEIEYGEIVNKLANELYMSLTID